MKYQSTTDKSVIEAYKLEEYNVDELHTNGVSIKEVSNSIVALDHLEKVLKLSYKGKHYTAQSNDYVIVDCDELHIFNPGSFEAAYKEYQEPKPSGMTFGQALEAMKQGKKIARVNWNGVGMWAVIQNGYPNGIAINKNTAEATGIEEGTVMKFRPYFILYTAQKDFAHWVPSGSDILAEDWQVIE